MSFDIVSDLMATVAIEDPEEGGTNPINVDVDHGLIKKRWGDSWDASFRHVIHGTTRFGT